VIIAKIDCTSAENKALCAEQGVKGFPTLKYSVDGSSWDKYEGSRELEALKIFVEESLSENCFDNEELCTEEEIKKLNELREIPREDLQKLLDENRATLEKAKETMENGVKRLQSEYAEMKTVQEEIDKEINKENRFLVYILKSTPPSQEL
jgi:thioredoxin-like negative regulator of GroEL